MRNKQFIGQGQNNDERYNTGLAEGSLGLDGLGSAGTKMGGQHDESSW